MIASLTLSCDRVCQVTTEVLACDFCHLLLWQPDERVYVAAGTHGATTEEWESLRRLRVPAEDLTTTLRRLQQEVVVSLREQDVPPAARPMLSGAARALCVAIVHGQQVTGFLLAAARNRRRRLSSKQLRMARSIQRLVVSAGVHDALAQQLERDTHLRSEFVATMSHELRSPLGVIMGYNDLLLEGAFGPLTPEQGEILRRIDEGVREALDLVNNTLNLARLETGHMPLEVEEIHLSELISELDAETRELQRRPGVMFVWDVPGDLPQLRTDSVKLKIVLKNLIINALKFTDQGRVTVAVRAHHDGIEFCVADTGIGMPPEAIPLIFDRFRQLNGGATRRRGGVGLGLYITRRLLEILGGTIAVESAPGRGSTFRIWLPAGGDVTSGDQPVPI
jgi:signal transduction histidine kinase